MKKERETQSIYSNLIRNQQGSRDKGPSRKTTGTVNSKGIP
jgi:hypothetical protein